MTERTTDKDFDIQHERFGGMIRDMNEVAAGINSVMMQQKQMFNDAHELAAALSRIYTSNADSEWPGCPSEMTHLNSALAYKECMKTTHDVVRSSAAMVVVERALEPMRAAVTKMAPEVDKSVKEREALVMDYDSYRRRLKDLERKRDDAEAQGKSGSSANQTTLAEITRFEAKMTNAESKYVEKNKEVKKSIKDSKKAHDQLMDMFLITVVCAQAELFKRAAAHLEAVVNTLPEDKVRQVRQQIESYVGQGGVRPVQPEAKGALGKGIDIFTGKAMPGDFAQDNPAFKAPSSSSSSTASAATSSSTSNNAAAKNASNPFGDTPDALPPSPTLPPPTLSPAPTIAVAQSIPSSSSGHFVIALYDHVAEADDELSFNVGERVEVLETGDGGWWKGRNIKDEEGLFPVNYVKT